MSAKWKRVRMRACVSVSKYMSVLRQTIRSTREIGASWIRSLRPKMTVRRSSFRKVWRPSACSKYRASSSGGTLSIARAS